MTSDQDMSSNERGLTPADLHNLRFTRAPMLRPGYVESEVDRVLARVAEDLGRLYSEKAALRDQVRSLQAQIDGVVMPEAPSEQALRILSSAQQTADTYVAEAEEFSRQVTSEARAEYEEQIRRARENAGAIIQAAQEAATKLGGSEMPAGADVPTRSVAELEEQVAYLKAFGQACRVQLRSYLEALLSDIELEWGKADPAAVPQAVPQAPPRPPAQRSGREGAHAGMTTFESNTVAQPSDDEAENGVVQVVAVRE
jgi:DivIVA domain-containing protein